MKMKTKMKKELLLYKAEPVAFLWIPKNIRILLGYMTTFIFAFSFMMLPISLFILPFTFAVWKLHTFGYMICFINMLLMSVPCYEWIEFRKITQLWYEMFDFHSNLSPEKMKEMMENGEKQKSILAMHPHGIIPLHSLLWASFCDQYMQKLYGFGAQADIVEYLPLLRSFCGWYSSVSANYTVLKNGLMYGKVKCIKSSLSSCTNNNTVRKPRHLFILAGGIAEIYQSKPGKNAIVLKNRRGLCRLSYETNSFILPCYVFGVDGFYNNFITGNNFISNFCRSMKFGGTLFWGPFLSFFPYRPKVTLIVGDPIYPKRQTDKPTKEELNEMHMEYMENMKKIFDDYKEVCGYPNAILEIE